MIAGVYLALFSTTMVIMRLREAEMSVALAAITIIFVLAFVESGASSMVLRRQLSPRLTQILVCGYVALYRSFVKFSEGPQAYWDLTTTITHDRAIVVISKCVSSHPRGDPWIRSSASSVR